MKHLSKRILACALALLLAFSMGAAAVSAAGAPKVTVKLSYADVTGFYVTPTREYVVPADISEEYGFIDDFNGAKASVMDAIVYLHLLTVGDVDGWLDALYDDYYESWMVTDFMGDGMGAFMSYVNGIDPGVSAFSAEIADGDTVSFFAIYDTYWWVDYFTWFEVGGQKTNAVTVVEGESLTLTLKATAWGYPVPGYHLEDAEIVLLDIADGGDYDYAVFDDATTLAVIDDEGSPETVSFAAAGVYYVSAASDYDYEPFMSPWLKVTVVTQAQAALAQAKNTAKAALDTYKNPADYRDAQKTALAAAIAAGKTAIDNATDTAGVTAALAAAKTAMDGIKTDAQLKAEETPPTFLEKWQAKLPEWMQGVKTWWSGFQYVILFVFFGWIWFLF